MWIGRRHNQKQPRTPRSSFPGLTGESRAKNRECVDALDGPVKPGHDEKEVDFAGAQSVGKVSGAVPTRAGLFMCSIASSAALWS